MKKNQKNQGITLVALVITVIIIIILATATINMTFGDNGLITQARKAKDMTANSIVAEQEEMNSLMDEYANVMKEDSEIMPPTPEKSEVADAIENNTQFTETTTITDDLDNPVTIPGGFHLASDSGTSVEKGIVIEDNTANKNQFVWIPVGTYNVTNAVDSDETKDGKMINELTRRTFTSSDSTEVSGDSGIDSIYYGEGATQNNDGSPITPVETNIEEFKTSATTKGGFYIGRYEQGTGNVCKYGVTPYVNVRRDEAKSQAESMYSDKLSIKATTELISSYAWDTALNFICQTNADGYELATTISSSFGNIGTGSRKNTGIDANDNYSNIHDLLGNCFEWTTEYNDTSIGVCISRGGYYVNSDNPYYFNHVCAASRNNDYITTVGDHNAYSFRVQLYV